MIYQALIKKNKVIFCGNGGSASDSEHISTELIGRYLKKEKHMLRFLLQVTVLPQQ